MGLVALVAAGFFFFGRARSLALVQGAHAGKLNSLPNHYGALSALWVLVPAVAVILLWSAAEPALVKERIIASVPTDLKAGLSSVEVDLLVNKIQSYREIGALDPRLLPALDALKGAEEMSARLRMAVVLLMAVATGLVVTLRFRQKTPARGHVERIVHLFLALSSWLAVLTTVGIFLSVLAESWRFFQIVTPFEFLFGTQWSPQIAIREDQIGASGAFGSVPVFGGTLLISLIALLIALPVGLLSAIYMTEYATKRVRSLVKPVLEILAGIPTVVYGFLAIVTIAPWLRGVGELIGLEIASESALVAGVVVGIMIIPFVSSLSDDVINAVPNSLRDGSLALGSTRSEMLCRVVLPAALPGIVGATLLAASRAIGETMIVVMAAGLTANLTVNPLDAVTTATVQIVTLLVGDQEFGNVKTLSAFALGLTLFLVTLLFNVVALRIVKKYRERY